MSYPLPSLETPIRPDNVEEILAEHFDVALDEIAQAKLEEAVDSEETVLGFFRRIVPIPMDNKHV